MNFREKENLSPVVSLSHEGMDSVYFLLIAVPLSWWLGGIANMNPSTSPLAQRLGIASLHTAVLAHKLA
jgi:hypothetical protein